MLKKIAVAFIAFTALSSAFACDYSWQRAKDGSSCGGRAADQRSGGN